MCMQVRRMLGVPLAHATADLVHGHPALVKPGREEVFAEYATAFSIANVQIQGRTANMQPLNKPLFGQVS